MVILKIEMINNGDEILCKEQVNLTRIVER